MRGFNIDKKLLKDISSKDPSVFHSMAEDFYFTLKKIRERNPKDMKLFSVGLSLGGNTIANYLGGFKGYEGVNYRDGYKGCLGVDNTLLNGAIIVSSPVNRRI